MTAQTKIDNRFLSSKLLLRRHFLQRYPPSSVLDCCQGEGVLWNILRKEFIVPSYFPVDVKRRKGRLPIDSVRLVSLPGASFDVVDIDTYGSPWKHWFALLPNLHNDCTVFLTIGSTRTAACPQHVDSLALNAAGLIFRNLHCPLSLLALMERLTHDYCLALASKYGMKTVEIAEAFPQKNARYLGLRLQVRKENDNAHL